LRGGGQTPCSGRILSVRENTIPGNGLNKMPAAYRQGLKTK
jgi:hypothetical protein